jgi:uncharacterized protein
MDYPSYDPQSAVTPLTEDELAALDELLASLPSDGAMTLDGMDGFLTALLVGPVPLASMRTADWLPLVWGGDAGPAPGPLPPRSAAPEQGGAPLRGAGAGTPATGGGPFRSNQQRKRTTVLVLRHLRAIDAALSGPPDAWEPIFSVAEVPGTHGDELADAGDWCLGFLAAMDLAPDAWAPLSDDPAIGPGLATIAFLGGDVDAPPAGESAEDEDLDDPQVRDQLSRAAADVVLQLHARRGA